MEQKYSLRSPAVKRLMREARELREPTELYYAQPLEDNLFEWHFCVRGPPDSDFAGGRYHGRITLPPEYPMKPPSIMILTPNGRFETGKKICLSMSAHHPETWQPSWSIRTVLMAIIGFMPSKGAGAIGSLDYTPQERKILAKKSLEWKCDVCNSCNVTALLESSENSQSSEEAEKEAAELAAQISFKGETEKDKEKNTTEDGPSQATQATAPVPQVNTPVGATMANNQVGAFPPYYAALQYPYYPTGYPIPNGSLPTNQMTSVATNHQSPSAGQSSTTNNASMLRQRSTVPFQASSVAVSTPVASPQPHVTQTSMASLLFMWFLGICILALLARRLFMAS